MTDDDFTYELAAETPGELDTLRLQRRARRAPAAGEVEIRVDATALHFRDLLKTLGAGHYAADTSALGTECAGEVVRVGADVTELAVGDPVIALSPGAFHGHLTLPATLVVRRPERLAADKAVDVGAFVTARVALERLAGIEHGDTVLIHAAAGATGLAAVEVARQHGAQVLGTASPWKWPAVRARGVRHVFHSRDTAFADQVRRATDGNGVQIVLNSLTGPAIGAGMTALRSGGCFVELGMAEVLTTDAAEAIRPDVRYRALDLVADVRREPVALRQMMTEVAESLASGAYAPLPRHHFRLDSAREAFRFMQQAQHIGRVVIDHRMRAGGAVRFSADAAYVIAGGLGGLGLLVSEWMVARGARHLVLVGRRGPDDAASRAIAELTSRGVEVRTVAADVSDAAAIETVIREIEAGDAPLRGVVHAAGVLDDGVLTRQHADRFASVFRPKVAGAWELHRGTRHLPLDFFVMFSSAASLVGAPGQGNHAAANAFLDGLAHYRRSCGLPASSIQWGAWSDTGAAARHASDGIAHAASLRTISPAEGLALLEALWPRQNPVLAAVRIDWEMLARGAGTARRPFLDLVIPRAVVVATSPATEPIQSRDAISLVERLAAADVTARAALVRAFVSEQVTRVLGLSSPEILSSRHGFFEMGMDSLTSLELRNALQRELGRPLPSTLTFDYPTVEQLSAWLNDELSGRVAAPAADRRAAIDTERDDAAAADVASLSAEELSVELEREVRSVLTSGG